LENEIKPMTITLFVPCFMDSLYPNVGMSVVRVLELLGHQVECPETLTCCGQPAFNSGYWEEARAVARPVLDQLKNAEVVVIPSGAGGAMLKVFYPQLFADSPQADDAEKLSAKVWEFSDFLVNKLGVTELGAKFPHKVTFHDGCHGLRELNCKRPPRELLAKVKGLELIEIAAAETCCGFGGHVRSQVSRHLHRDGRGEMRQRAGNQDGLHCLERLQLFDAHSRAGEPPTTAAQNHSSGRGAGTTMKTPAANFKSEAGRVAGDRRQRGLIQTALGKYEVARDALESAFQDWQAARQAASQTKYEAINNLDKYLDEFVAKLEARGTKVHWASTGKQARDIILDIIRQTNARSIIKSKAMTAEEIHLNAALEQAGLEVVESDLGEFIVQLRHEPPYHIVFPAMHLTRGEISELFEKELGSAPTNSPEELTMIARRALRKKYLTADVGVTGANFAIAETGMVSITENEGNARLTAAMPKAMITLLGIEKILPKMSDLALFLPMLATAGAGQALTCYNTLYGGPKQADECDGPQEWHVVLLDNHRTELLADAEQRDALHCIRCGACLNVCPIFRNVGGHTYGTTYSGPIGSVITPHLRGLQDWKHLSNASSLCGACTETCPVKIDLHHHLLQNRRNVALEKPSCLERFGFRMFAAVVNRPWLYRSGQRVSRFLQPLHALVKGSILDPGRPWTKSRDLPLLAKKSFKQLWKERA